jgi:hypothetical protein
LILHLSVSKRMIFILIYGLQSESLGRQLVFHQLLPYERDNAIPVFRKFIVVVSLT